MGRLFWYMRGAVIELGHIEGTGYVRYDTRPAAVPPAGNVITRQASFTMRGACFGWQGIGVAIGQRSRRRSLVADCTGDLPTGVMRSQASAAGEVASAIDVTRLVAMPRASGSPYWMSAAMPLMVIIQQAQRC